MKINETKKKPEKKEFNFAVLGMCIFGVAILLFLGVSPFYIVQAGERAVLLTFGDPSMTPVAEGLHFKVPLVQTVVIMDVKTQKYEADASAASKDLQTVTAKIVTNYHLVPESVPRLYKEIGRDYTTRVIQPMEQEVTKANTAKFTAEELITKREEVRQGIKTMLKERLAERGIIVEEVSIVNFDFSPEFSKAIEAKVTQEQMALTAKNKLEQTKYEADQRIAQAKGEAEAIKIQAASIQTQGGAAYVQLQAINKWNGALPTFMSSSSNGLPFLMSIPTTVGTG